MNPILVLGLAVLTHASTLCSSIRPGLEGRRESSSTPAAPVITESNMCSKGCAKVSVTAIALHEKRLGQGEGRLLFFCFVFGPWASLHLLSAPLFFLGQSALMQCSRCTSGLCPTSDVHC